MHWWTPTAFNLIPRPPETLILLSWIRSFISLKCAICSLVTAFQFAMIWLWLVEVYLSLRYEHLGGGFLCVVDKTDKLWAEKWSSDIRNVFCRRCMSTCHFRQIPGPAICVLGEFRGLHVIFIETFAVWRLGFFNTDCRLHFFFN